MALDQVGPRVLGVDHGTRRTGLAVSDPSGTIAHPLEVFEGAEDAVVRRIANLVADREVGEVVVGLPRNMDGTVGPQGRTVLSFASRLAAALGIPVRTWDERLTSVQADLALAPPERKGGKPGRLSREDRLERRDKVAASLLLQSYLDARGRGRTGDERD